MIFVKYILYIHITKYYFKKQNTKRSSEQGWREALSRILFGTTHYVVGPSKNVSPYLMGLEKNFKKKSPQLAASDDTIKNESITTGSRYSESK